MANNSAGARRGIKRHQEIEIDTVERGSATNASVPGTEYPRMGTVLHVPRKVLTSRVALAPERFGPSVGNDRRNRSCNSNSILLRVLGRRRSSPALPLRLYRDRPLSRVRARLTIAGRFHWLESPSVSVDRQLPRLRVAAILRLFILFYFFYSHRKSVCYEFFSLLERERFCR